MKILWRIYSGALFVLVKTLLGLPSVALHTSTTCSRGCDSFDTPSPSTLPSPPLLPPSTWMSWVKKEKEKRKHQKISDSSLLAQGKRNTKCPQERRYRPVAQVFRDCWRLRVVRDPEPAADSGGFRDTVFTRHVEVGALQQTAPYMALSIISRSIQENRSSAGRTVWKAQLWKNENSRATINGTVRCCWK